MVDVNCEKTVLKQMGDRIDSDTVKQLYEEASEQLRRMKRVRNKPVSKAMREWLDKQADTAKRDAAIKKMNAANNALARSEMFRSILDANFGTGKDLAKAVPAIIWGDGARTEFSADAIKDAYWAKWSADLEFALDAIGDTAYKYAADASNTLDIVKAMEGLARGGDLSHMNKMAVDTARAIREVTENIRRELNDAGAFIGNIDDYIWKQVHDMHKISAVSAEQWQTDLLDNLDFVRTFGFSRQEMADDLNLHEMVIEVVDQWYDDFATGNHMKINQPIQDAKGKGTGRGNIAKRISQERKIHFADAEAFYEYQKKYGLPSIFDALQMNIRASSRHIGLMTRLGPNYADNAFAVNDLLIKRAKKERDLEAVSALSNNRISIQNALDAVDGTTDAPVNGMFAKLFQATRKIMGMSKLGSAAFATASDLSNMAANANVNGENIFSSYAKGLNGLLKNVPERNRTAKALGIALDYNRAGVITADTAVDAGPGMLSKMQERFFRWSGLSAVTNRHRATVAIAESVYLGESLSSGAKYADLDIKYQRKLGLHEITEAEWTALSKAVQRQDFGDGEFSMITPEAIRDLSDADVSRLLLGNQKNVTKPAIKKARTELENKIRSFYQDTVDKTVIEPKTRTRSATLLHTREGTPMGVLMRQLMQFKSFPIAVLMQRVQADIYLRTGKRATAKDALMSTSWMPAMASLALQTTVMGYVAMSLKDIWKARDPRDPTEDSLKVALAAFTQGGAAGILGDFLFAEQNRFGGGILSTLAGPSGDALRQVHDIYGQIKGNVLHGDDNAWFGQALKFGYNNTPFLNLFYLKPILDYHFMDRVMNELRPGYTQRAAMQRERDTGQKTWTWALQKEGF